MLRFRRQSLVLSLALMPFLLPGHVVTAQQGNGPLTLPGAFVQLRGTGDNSSTSVGIVPGTSSDSEATTSQGMTFDVTYRGFTAEAEAAFRHAVAIWSGKLTSPVAVSIDATWTDLGAGIAGEAAASSFVRDFPNAPRAGTYYPVALASSLAGTKLNSDQPDIVAELNSAFDWYVGTDGKCPPGETDLVSVVLHELGHGLGFTVPAQVSEGVGAFGSPGAPARFVFGTLIVTGSGRPLTADFGNPSSALGIQFTGNDLFLDGINTVAAAGGSRARLYAPSEWRIGTSITHLDEARYPAGDVNSLMTPFLGWAESIHDPGPIMMGLLQDLGWKLPGNLADTPAGGAFRVPAGPLDISVVLDAAMPGGNRQERRQRVAFAWISNDAVHHGSGDPPSGGSCRSQLPRS